MKNLLHATASMLAASLGVVARPTDESNGLTMRPGDPLDFDAIMKGPRLFEEPHVILGRGVKRVHYPVPNPKAERRKAMRVAEMQARKKRKRGDFS